MCTTGWRGGNLFQNAKDSTLDISKAIVMPTPKNIKGAVDTSLDTTENLITPNAQEMKKDKKLDTKRQANLKNAAMTRNRREGGLAETVPHRETTLLGESQISTGKRSRNRGTLLGGY